MSGSISFSSGLRIASYKDRGFGLTSRAGVVDEYTQGAKDGTGKRDRRLQCHAKALNKIL